MITSIWNTAVIFRPSSVNLRLLLITNQLNDTSIEQKKGNNVVEMPLGNRIV